MRYVTGFFRFWYDFIVGDAWEIAAGIVLVMASGAALVRSDAVSSEVAAPLVALGFILVVGASILAEARRRTRA